MPNSINDCNVRLVRYSDEQRINLARNAAIYLGKDDRDNIRRPLTILKKGHTLEIFRGEYAEFEYEGVSKEVYDHLTTYTTRNMRIAGGNRALTSNSYVLPNDRMVSPSKVEKYIQANMENYNNLCSFETPQVARSAMPCSAIMHPFVLQFNFATLIQAIFPQRLWTNGAQANTRIVAMKMFNELLEVDEELWRVAEEYNGIIAQSWMQAYRNLVKTPQGKKVIENLINEHGKTKSMWE
jgi:hypothetical protein